MGRPNGKGAIGNVITKKLIGVITGKKEHFTAAMILAKRTHTKPSVPNAALSALTNSLALKKHPKNM